MLNKRDKLKTIAEILLNKDSSDEQLIEASQNLLQFFSEETGFHVGDPFYNLSEADKKAEVLESGVAVAPFSAGIIVSQHLRVAKFLRGAFKALQDLKEKFPNEKLHILYAGTGPFGTLITPLLPLLIDENLEITFLDISEVSINYLKRIVSSIDANNLVKDFIVADATKYKANSPVHLIISETMKESLEEEPQVSITLNLLPQLQTGGVFIPERIVVSCEVMKTHFEGEKINKEYYLLGDVVDLNTKKRITKEEIVVNNFLTFSKEKLLKTPVLEKSCIRYIGTFTPMFSTYITVYDEFSLKEGESPLTQPMPLDIENLEEGDTLDFDYEISSFPKIVYKIRE